MATTYRGYTIRYDPPPIPVRDFDWEWSHKDYDGDPESSDGRAGVSVSLDEAKAAIDAQISESETQSGMVERAREWGEAYGFPVVLYEWLPGSFDVVHLSLWREMPNSVASLAPHALVYRDSIIPLQLLTPP